VNRIGGPRVWFLGRTPHQYFQLAICCVPVGRHRFIRRRFGAVPLRSRSGSRFPQCKPVLVARVRLRAMRIISAEAVGHAESPAPSVYRYIVALYDTCRGWQRASIFHATPNMTAASTSTKLRLHDLLRNGRAAFGTFMMLSSGRTAQVVAQTGLDVSKLCHVFR